MIPTSNSLPFPSRGGLCQAQEEGGRMELPAQGSWLPALEVGRPSHAGANAAMWTAAISKMNMPPGAIRDEAITSPSPLAAWVSEGRQ